MLLLLLSVLFDVAVVADRIMCDAHMPDNGTTGTEYAGLGMSPGFLAVRS